MLSYAFRVLQEDGYQKLAAESFDNTADLCAAILEKGISIQIKRGLLRDYISNEGTIFGVRGQLNISESIKKLTFLDRKMVCNYDEFSVNAIPNRIIKSTVLHLLRLDISSERTKTLRRLMKSFCDIEPIDLRVVNWNQDFHKYNPSYQTLVSICFLTYKGLLQTEEKGSFQLVGFKEEHMHNLFERFILEYYRKEWDIDANPSQIPWQLDDDNKNNLPQMRTDVTLSRGNNILIIDAKYYAKTMQKRFEVETIHSGNLYQIFAYVKNKEYELRDKEHKVAGILLYAKTDEDVVPNVTYRMSGNQISVKTLDLNCDFSYIRSQLDNIASTFFVS